MLCECSNLDWRDVDQTAQHHPDCLTVEITDRYWHVEVRGPEITVPLKSISQETLDDFYYNLRIALDSL